MGFAQLRQRVPAGLPIRWAIGLIASAPETLAASAFTAGSLDLWQSRIMRRAVCSEASKWPA
jgi:hypothetical protein